MRAASALEDVGAPGFVPVPLMKLACGCQVLQAVDAAVRELQQASDWRGTCRGRSRRSGTEPGSPFTPAAATITRSMFPADDSMESRDICRRCGIDLPRPTASSPRPAGPPARCIPELRPQLSSSQPFSIQFVTVPGTRARCGSVSIKQPGWSRAICGPTLGPDRGSPLVVHQRSPRVGGWTWTIDALRTLGRAPGEQRHELNSRLQRRVRPCARADCAPTGRLDLRPTPPGSPDLAGPGPLRRGRSRHVARALRFTCSSDPPGVHATTHGTGPAARPRPTCRRWGCACA